MYLIFDYRPLNTDRNKIRLISLLGNPDKATKVVCMQAHPRTSRPSSVWYTASMKLYLIHGATTFSLSRQYWTPPGSLLRRTLNQLFEPCVRKMKVDICGCMPLSTLCIHQRDTVEVNQQVLRMLKFYKNAPWVVVWPGPEVATTGMAIKHLKFLKEQWDESKFRKLSARIPKITVFLRSLHDMLWRLSFYLLRLRWSDAILPGTVLFIRIIAPACSLLEHQGTGHR